MNETFTDDLSGTAEDTASDTSGQETNTSDSASSGGNNGSKTANQTIPYSRFREVIEKNRAMEAQMQELYSKYDELAKSVPRGANGDSVNKQLQQARFKDKYTTADELFGDIKSNLPSDDEFIEKILDALDKKGEKTEDWAFNLLLRKQEREAKRIDADTQKAIQRNTDTLRNLEETEFAEDPEGFKQFMEFAKSMVGRPENPYKGELMDLYYIFKDRLYKRDEEKETTTKRIAKVSRPGTKEMPKVNVSNMTFDQLAKLGR